jgi:hypothetical protein
MTDPMMDVATEAQQPFRVCISKLPDGTFEVEKEPPEGTEGPEMPEGSEGDMGEDQSEGMQPAATIDEALDLARQMLQDAGASPEDAALAGYNKGKPPAQRMNTSKVFGE